VPKQRRIRRCNDGICVYCSQRDAETDDHIPPKNLFGKPRPSSLVTVPSCFFCNAGASLDDEYFRLVVALRHDVDHPDAAVARDSAMRSLARPQAGGLRAAFLSATREVELRSPGGLYVGRTGAYDINIVRLDRIARRITLGLFYKEKKVLLSFVLSSCASAHATMGISTNRNSKNQRARDFMGDPSSRRRGSAMNDNS
jgi:hypothetical protein